jgi:hypothetical protein
VSIRAPDRAAPPRDRVLHIRILICFHVQSPRRSPVSLNGSDDAATARQRRRSGACAIAPDPVQPSRCLRFSQGQGLVLLFTTGGVPDAQDVHVRGGSSPPSEHC